MYSLAKELGTEMVRVPSSRLTGAIPSNQTFREEESISAAAASSVSRHGQVISQYGQRFAATDRLDRRFHRLLGRAFELRQLADYSVEAELEPGVVEDLIAEGEAFLGTARKYLRDRANQE